LEIKVLEDKVLDDQTIMVDLLETIDTLVEDFKKEPNYENFFKLQVHTFSKVICSIYGPDSDNNLFKLIEL
jgi:hypothetical protein